MKGVFPFAVAVTSVIATALPACSSNDGGSNHQDAGASGGNGGTSPGSGGSTQDSGKTDSGAGATTSGGCKTDDDCTATEECTNDACVTKTVCPDALQPTFDSLNANVFSKSCGTDGGICHSPDGALNSGQLDLADDAYTALLGADGKGAPGNNISGTEKDLLRVAPGDPDTSFLVIKLSTHVSRDPKYGSGMPFTDPGEVCPDTLSTIRAWITAGAKK